MWEILTGEEPYADMHYGEVIGMLMKLNLKQLHRFANVTFAGCVNHICNNSFS